MNIYWTLIKLDLDEKEKKKRTKINHDRFHMRIFFSQKHQQLNSLVHENN